MGKGHWLTSDAQTMQSMMSEEYVGKTLEFSASGSFEFVWAVLKL